MGFRMRKSVKIAPGVKVNFSKSGVGYSVGGKRARVTKRADGRTTTSVRGPGGLSYSTSSKSSQKRSSSRPAQPGRAAQPPPPAAPKPAKPTLLAPKGEKQLFNAIKNQDVDLAEQVAQEHPDYALPASAVAAAFHLNAENSPRAEALLSWVLATGQDPAQHPFMVKYPVSTAMTVAVVPGLSAEIPFDRTCIGLVLAELRQHHGDLAGAANAVEELEPTTLAALSLAELYSDLERFGEVIELTNGMTNTDNLTAYLVVFRGIALRELGYFDAARQAFKEALKSKAREPLVRHRAWMERATCYEAEGKRGMARKDLERVMAEDASYEGLAAAFASLENA